MRTAGMFTGKVAGAFLVVLTAVGSAAVFSIDRLASSAAEREAAARQHVGDLVLAERLRSADAAMASTGRGYLLTHNPEFLQKYADATVEFGQALGDLRSRVTTAPGTSLLDDVRAAAATYTRAQHRVMAEVSDGAMPEEVARHFELEVVPNRRQLSKAIDAFVAHVEELLTLGEGETRAMNRRAIVGAISMLAGALAASAALAWLMGRDLARSYRKEEEAVQAAERALVARDEVLGIVAHDLRSPLSAIAMKAAMVRRSSEEEKTRRHASTIESVARRMELLIAGLMDSASIESSALTVRPAACDVEELLREALKELGSLAEPKSIQLELHLPETRLAVMGDRARLLQVLNNVIGNAIKFSFEGGRVDVAVERAGDDVRFSVADTGPGIAPAAAPHVFERFWKAETGGKRGTGLGLYIAKGIVEAHGGRIWVESGLGHGSTFFFTLALTALRPAGTDERVEAAPPH